MSCDFITVTNGKKSETLAILHGPLMVPNNQLQEPLMYRDLFCFTCKWKVSNPHISFVLFILALQFFKPKENPNPRKCLGYTCIPVP